MIQIKNLKRKGEPHGSPFLFKNLENSLPVFGRMAA
jgi:hypothetical protein